MRTFLRFIQRACVLGTWCSLLLSTKPGHAGLVTVTTLADSGSGSLRAAISDASPGDTICFAVAGTITNLTGELLIPKDLELLGPGAKTLALSGNDSVRVLNIASGATVKLSGLTICDGHARDGAKGTDSAAPGSPGEDGGGIYNSGTLTVTNCTIVRCRSGNGGAGFGGSFPGTAGSSEGGPGGNGGGIYNAGMLVLVNCNVLTNSSGRGGSGGSPLSGGLPGSRGGSGGTAGGIYDVGVLSLIGCTLGYNHAGAGGAGGRGGVGSDSPADGGSGGPGGNGGFGGALYAQTTPSLVSCTVFGNTAGAGGSGGAGGTGADGSFPVGTGPGGNGGFGGDAGSGGDGGGVYSSGGIQSTACTIAGNSAGPGGNGGPGGAGGFSSRTGGGDGGNGGNGGNGGSGGGVGSWSGSSMQNVLAAANTAGPSGSPGAGGAAGSGSPRGATGLTGSGGSAGSGPDLLGGFTSNGHNLVGLDAGNSGFIHGVSGDLVGSSAPLDPLLAPLANRGGLTLTCALLPGSPALDAGDDSLLAAPWNLLTDQRGVPRLCLAHVDIGAFELGQASTPFLVAAGADEMTGAPKLSLTNLPGASLTVLATTNASLPVSSWTIVGAMPEVAPGQFEFVDPAAFPFRFYRLCSP
ncbi:MAG TPA: choice-of-anchor Q domain-containing protein [Verrucomicrobiae bacterium]